MIDFPLVVDAIAVGVRRGGVRTGGDFGSIGQAVEVRVFPEGVGRWSCAELGLVGDPIPVSICGAGEETEAELVEVGEAIKIRLAAESSDELSRPLVSS